MSKNQFNTVLLKHNTCLKLNMLVWFLSYLRLKVQLLTLIEAKHYL